MLDIIIFITFDELKLNHMKRIIAVLAISVFTLGMAQETPKKSCCAAKDKKECSTKDKKECSTKDKKECTSKDKKDCKAEANKDKKSCCAAKKEKAA